MALFDRLRNLNIRYPEVGEDKKSPAAIETSAPTTAAGTVSETPATETSGETAMAPGLESENQEKKAGSGLINRIQSNMPTEPSRPHDLGQQYLERTTELSTKATPVSLEAEGGVVDWDGFLELTRNEKFKKLFNQDRVFDIKEPVEDALRRFRDGQSDKYDLNIDLETAVRLGGAKASDADEALWNQFIDRVVGSGVTQTPAEPGTAIEETPPQSGVTPEIASIPDGEDVTIENPVPATETSVATLIAPTMATSGDIGGVVEPITDETADYVPEDRFNKATMTQQSESEPEIPEEIEEPRGVSAPIEDEQPGQPLSSPGVGNIFELLERTRNPQEVNNLMSALDKSSAPEGDQAMVVEETSPAESGSEASTEESTKQTTGEITGETTEEAPPTSEPETQPETVLTPDQKMRRLRARIEKKERSKIPDDEWERHKDEAAERESTAILPTLSAKEMVVADAGTYDPTIDYENASLRALKYSERAQSLIDSVEARKKDRENKRTERKQRNEERRRIIKETIAKGWENVKNAPASGINTLDERQLRFRAGISGQEAKMIEYINDLTNSAAESIGEKMGYLESLVPRAKESLSRKQLEHLQRRAEKLRSIIEQSQFTEGGEIVTKADALKAKAEEMKKQSETAKAQPTRLSGVRGFLKRFMA